MSRLLFTVESTFLLPRHGLVLLPGIVAIGDESFRIGSPLLLRRPDGIEVRASIAGIEIPNPNPSHAFVPLIKGFDKEEVPIGTQVWNPTDAQLST
jgi:hypothetical protein